MKKPSANLQKLMAGGQGLSDWPSDNASTLDPDVDWRWIDALHAIDQKQDPLLLIDLLAHERVPETIMPFLVDWLDRKCRPRRGRPAAPLYAPTYKAIAYARARAQMLELIDEGQSVEAAAEIIAPQWQLTVNALINVYLGKGGPSRRALRRRRGA